MLFYVHEDVDKHPHSIPVVFSILLQQTPRRPMQLLAIATVGATTSPKSYQLLTTLTYGYSTVYSCLIIVLYCGFGIVAIGSLRHGVWLAHRRHDATVRQFWVSVNMQVPTLLEFSSPSSFLEYKYHDFE